MFVEGACEVDADKLMVVQSQTHTLAGKAEIVEVVGVHSRVTVRLEGAAWKHNIGPVATEILIRK